MASILGYGRKYPPGQTVADRARIDVLVDRAWEAAGVTISGGMTPTRNIEALVQALERQQKEIACLKATALTRPSRSCREYRRRRSIASFLQKDWLALPPSWDYHWTL